MNDDELIGYCEIHCKSERALFSAEHINRMSALAGGYCHRVSGWLSLHEEMDEMCRLARERTQGKS